MVDNHTDVAAVRHHDIHEKTGSSFEVRFGEALNVFFVDHGCALGRDGRQHESL